MRKKYRFVLEDLVGHTMYGDAHTLCGVKTIFNKMSGANKCSVFKRHKWGVYDSPFIIYQK